METNGVYDLDLMKQRYGEIQAAVAKERTNAELLRALGPGAGGPRAWLDAAIVRVSRGAVRRHAERQALAGTPPGEPREPRLRVT